MTEIRTQAWNPVTGIFETIDREPGTYDDLMLAELSAEDQGCDPGTIYRLQQVDDEDHVLNERLVKAL